MNNKKYYFVTHELNFSDHYLYEVKSKNTHAGLCTLICKKENAIKIVNRLNDFDKLLDFVKTMSNEQDSILSLKDFYIPLARKLLKEIGEL